METLLYTLTMASVAHAQQPETVGELMGRINQYVLNPLIGLLFAVSFVLFLVGLYNFFKNKDSEAAVEQGKRHMTWGIFGMFIMVSVFGIMSLITSSLDITGIDAQNNLEVDIDITDTGVGSFITTT